MGYLPRELFFNAFQLGAESLNQVFSSEEASTSITSFLFNHFLSRTQLSFRFISVSKATSFRTSYLISLIFINILLLIFALAFTSQFV
jgi:hypothetical protein